MAEADPGQDPLGLVMDPLWEALDTTLEGRGADSCSELSYESAK